MNEISQKSRDPSVNLGCVSWPSTLLTIAIIAIRAFQPEAEPMSAWSAGSWCLMMIPLFLPFIVFIVMTMLIAIGVACGACK